MEEVFSTKSIEETQKLAQDFAKKIASGGVVLLYGNLGAGKTTFVQGLAKGLGITHRIISPTFIILRTYEIPSLSSRAKSRDLYHVDLYRLESEKEIEGLGLVDLLKNSDNIIVIEWPERMGTLLPKNAWKISIETTGENEREITIKK